MISALLLVLGACLLVAGFTVCSGGGTGIATKEENWAGGSMMVLGAVFAVAAIWSIAT